MQVSKTMRIKLPVRPIYIPAELSLYANGNVDASLLQEVQPGCFLYREAAQAWLQLRQAAAENGFVLKPVNNRACYRTNTVQEDIFHARYVETNALEKDVVIWQGRFWRRKTGVMSVAVPGTSLHGLGLAVNVAQVRRGTPLLTWLLDNVEKYGWCWASQQRPWHLVYEGRKILLSRDQPLRQYSADETAAFFEGTWTHKPKEDWRLTNVACSLKAVPTANLLALRSKERYSPGTTLARIKREGLCQSVALLTDRTTLRSPLNNPVLQVTSLTTAVERWISVKRSSFNGRIFTVTGSAGKSTTTNILSKALRAQGQCLSSVFTNVMDGIYPAALRLEDQDFAVFETAQGALPRSAETLSADVAILVSIAPAHMDRHATLEDLARCKAGVFAGAKTGSIAIINRDVPCFDIVSQIAKDYGRIVITYGKSDDSDFKLLHYLKEEAAFVFMFQDRTFKVKQAILGEHIALNSLAVIAAMHAVGLNWPYSLRYFPDITQPPPGRGDVHDISLSMGMCKILNHSYNANPASVHASLKTLSDYPSQNGTRHIAVLSDMLEMGNSSADLHKSLGQAVLASDVQLLILVGENIRCIRQELTDGFPCIEFSSVELLFDSLPGLLRPGDIVLFCGSNGTGLNSALKDFLNQQHER